MHGDRWVKLILHNPKTKKFYPKYNDLIAMYKIEQPIKVQETFFKKGCQGHLRFEKWCLFHFSFSLYEGSGS